MLIESPQNKFVKQIMTLKTKKGRDRLDLFFIEGEKFVAEIPPDWPVYRYVMTEAYYREKGMPDGRREQELCLVTEKLFAAMTDTVTPQGVMAVCYKKKHDLQEVLSNAGFLILAESVTDPGNVGTLVRTADGLGADAVLFTGGSADAYGPKAARSAAGSVFHIPILEGVDLADTMRLLRERRVQTAGAHLRGGHMLYNVDFRKPSCLLIGNEARGLTDEAAGLCSLLVKIPMPGKAESFNASVAGGILMYEVARQKLIENNAAEEIHEPCR